MVRAASKKLMQRSGIVLVLLALFAGLLTACGEDNKTINDLNFTLPIYNGLNELPALANSPQFTSKILASQDAKNFPERSIRVFTTNSPLTDVRNFYVTQLTNLGWNNRTATLLGADSLGNDGWVLGFEKPAGNGTGRSRGMMMVGPNANGTDNFLKQFRDNGAIPSGQNLLVVIDGLYSPNGTPAAPTSTPRP